jgi:DNA-binding transcriptional LysR family regulator
LSISLLKTFIAISENGSFSAAADHVYLSHAAVGQQMKRLEESLQVTLFDRSKKSPQFNQLGMALVPKAREVVNAYETMLDELTGDAELIGELNLGAVPSVIRALIPLSIQKLAADLPRLNIRVVPGLTPHLLGLVEQGSIDAAVISSPVNISPNLHWKPFVEEELILLVSEQVTENDPIKLLTEMPYIRHTRRSSVGVLADEWLTNNGISVDVSMEMESLDAIYSMVAHQLGISIVPNQCVPDPMFCLLKKIPLGKEAKPRVLGILTRSDCSKANLVNRLLDEMNRTVEKHRTA